MTREEWEREFWSCFLRLRNQRGYDMLAAQAKALEITRARYGPQPPKPSLWLRLGLSLAGRKLAGLAPVRIDPMWQRAIVAVVYGVGAASPILVAAFEDNVITGGEWGGIATAFLVAFWGTFKSNTTVIAPNRTVWSPDERAVEVAVMDASVKVEEAKVVASEKVADAKVIAAAKVEDAKPGK